MCPRFNKLICYEMSHGCNARVKKHRLPPNLPSWDEDGFINNYSLKYIMIIKYYSCIINTAPCAHLCRNNIPLFFHIVFNSLNKTGTLWPRAFVQAAWTSYCRCRVLAPTTSQMITAHLKEWRIPNKLPWAENAVETPEKEAIMPITVRQSGGWFDSHRKVGIISSRGMLFVEDVNWEIPTSSLQVALVVILWLSSPHKTQSKPQPLGLILAIFGHYSGFVIRTRLTTR